MAAIVIGRTAAGTLQGALGEHRAGRRASDEPRDDSTTDTNETDADRADVHAGTPSIPLVDVTPTFKPLVTAADFMTKIKTAGLMASMSPSSWSNSPHASCLSLLDAATA
ncbi:hypothetical protein [Nocardioides alcanivorans]|uniref:hypothetical protein n=1 Tax=Nocardioides alcanivorans TaxID=2897352 RepID=UPI001F276F73|nr:hypothetical protein [Nocardioides alcanivorans]